MTYQCQIIDGVTVELRDGTWRSVYQQLDFYSFATAQEVAMAAEIERLQTALKPLPKTADGLPLYPGMKIWKVDVRGEIVGPWEVGHIHSNSVVTIRQSPGVVISRLASELYSNREAAEAVRDN